MIVDTVKTDRFSIDYFKFGSGSKTLVIIPGLAVQSIILSAQLVADAYAPMTKDLTIYVFDRRKDMPENYSPYDAAEDLAEAIGALGLEKVNLFGASYGGMISMTIAIRHPELVEKVVLCSTVAKVSEDESGALKRWLETAERGETEELFMDFGQSIYPAEVFEQSRELMLDAAKASTKEDLEKFIISSRGILGFDVEGALLQINCPVFLACDKTDRVFSVDSIGRIGEILKDKPSFEMHVYNGYGHALYDVAPDFQERMTEFLLK